MSRSELDDRGGYWRSLEHLAEMTAGSQDSSGKAERAREIPSNPWTRRNFLTLMGASMALAGLAGCRRPVDKIVPYVSQLEEVIPGVPRYYATTMPLGNSAYGLIVESHEGRPTKIEGNPEHPASLGSADCLTLASILGLYDPDRSKSVRHKNIEKSYADFVSFWRERHSSFTAGEGSGLAVLSEAFSSPTLARLKRDFAKSFPAARWVAYEPISDENIYRAVQNLTGKTSRPIYDYDRADVILSLDCDFLQTESENVAAARRFADGRRIIGADHVMNRLYVAECAFSVTGGMADHRLRLRSGEIGRLLLALAGKLSQMGVDTGNVPPSGETYFDERWLTALAEDLVRTKGKSLIVAGRRQPVWVHEVTLALNAALGNIDETVSFHGMPDALSTDRDEFAGLVNQMSAGAIDTLVILGGNPVYDAPADVNFSAALGRVEHTVHLSAYYDETSRQAEWHVPRAHFLESWGDARSADGTVSVIQPMIEPLYGGHADTEIFALMAGGRELRGYDIVRETWQSLLKGGDFEKQWRSVLHDGRLADSATPPDKYRAMKSWSKLWSEVPSRPAAASANSLEIGFYPSHLYDGRYANNGWLQELPDAVTKLAWDNAALISPKTAEELAVANNDMVRLEFDGRSLEMPVWVTPGQADYAVALALGYGREGLGQIADGVGFNTYLLRTTGADSFGRGAVLAGTGQTYALANTQDHSRMAGRPIIREATVAEYRDNPEFAREMVEHPALKSIYPDHDYSRGYQWGMVIDLNVCIGCNACTIACQSENNIPVVGKAQVARGREMHWIRNDRYFVGDLDDPRMVHQPVACQQCENAPCEQVCPVAATSHDREGLNTMNYNRCIGTRYCSNNCPYKVRRFNFFNYVSEMAEVVKMAQNPDVTVRSRGVMEKCTFCLQRINRAKQQAKKENRLVRDGEIMTACQQACPTSAIQFGNINDPDSQVAKLKQADRKYDLLAEFNVRPRNSYLAKLTNPNPKLSGGSETG
ncbi:MAG: Fe-S-cluster-containing hydrogenase [candidate division Zixibacteria bacterium]|nr:Fe-S-cluster-containing hydrogenase [candidate division Zixibacteria bacterium]